jgi:hypothetical protein
MTNLSEGATRIMTRLKQLRYRHGDYLAAGRLFYEFDNEAEKRRSVEELVAQGLVHIAPNGAIGITPAGEDWNEGNDSVKE